MDGELGLSNLIVCPFRVKGTAQRLLSCFSGKLEHFPRKYHYKKKLRQKNLTGKMKYTKKANYANALHARANGWGSLVVR